MVFNMIIFSRSLVTTMQTFNTFLMFFLCVLSSNGDDSKEPDLYYYGLEESERSLPACEPRQACSVFIERYWRRAALVRLCRCPRRARCDTVANVTQTLPWNNRASFQFCSSVNDWPVCSYGTAKPPITVQTTYDRINPDELETLHHKKVHLVPPKVVFTCRCSEPNYWMRNNSAELENTQIYQCSSLPSCTTGELCGNVDYVLYALYQSCLCPKHHICVHDGGIAFINIKEMLYKGKGWRSYCQKVSEDYSYEDY